MQHKVEEKGAADQCCDGIQLLSEASLASGAMWSADEVAELCCLHYRTRLPKQGKPDPSREWTSLAAVVKVESATQREVLASPGTLQGKTEPWGLGQLVARGEEMVAVSAFLFNTCKKNQPLLCLHPNALLFAKAFTTSA